MENKKFIEDDFNLDEFQSEFKEIQKYNYYEKNKHKFNALFYLIMIVSVAAAFLIYMIIQNFLGVG